MTATITEAKTALAAALAQDGVQVLTAPPGSVNTPAIVITPSPGSFDSHTTLDGEEDLTLTVMPLVSRGSDRSAMTKLEDMLNSTGDRSVFARIEADPTLGGVVSSAMVTATSDFGSYAFGGPEYLGAALTVSVLL